MTEQSGVLIGLAESRIKESSEFRYGGRESVDTDAESKKSVHERKGIR